MIDKDLMLMKLIRASAVAGMIACVAFVIASAYTNAEEFADDYWYIPDIRNEYESRWVPVYYVDEIITCDIHNNNIHWGCFYKGPNREDITIVKGTEDNWVNQGCTVTAHEFYHAMGWGHGMGPLSYTCDNPNTITMNNTNISYDENNVKHWNPIYEPVFREPNPKMIRWE